MELSIVTTLYYSEGYIKEFYKRISESAAKITDDYEIIFVNDGSPDKSLQTAIEIHETDSHVKIVNLSRNFGHHKAILAGLSQAQGEYIFLIDIDLEEKPEWLKQFWEVLHDQKVDAVFGVQEKRTGDLYKRLTGTLFYKIFNLISEIKIPENACTVRLMSSSYVNALLSLKDQNLFLAGNVMWAGFSQIPIYVNKSNKKTISYSPLKTLLLAWEAISSFSAYPLRIVLTIGLLISIASLIIGAVVFARKIIAPEAIQLGYSSIILSIWFLGGVTIFFIGIIGLYISKIFSEVKERPQYIIKKIYAKS